MGNCLQAGNHHPTETACMGETASNRIKTALLDGCSVTDFLEHAEHGGIAILAANCFPTFISFVLSTQSTFLKNKQL